MILTTEEAAALLNRKPQTLRKWSAFDDGPITPININGRLAWRKADIERLLGCAVNITQKPADPTKRRGRPTREEAAKKAMKRNDLSPFFALFEVIGNDKEAVEKIGKAFSKSPYAIAFLEAERHAKNIGLV